jgi:signal transduction histidine kinase
MYRRRRRTLRLQLTLWFVVALLVVEGSVLFAYWVSRDEPLLIAAEERLQTGLRRLLPILEAENALQWREEELLLLALRADVDLLTLVGSDAQVLVPDARTTIPEPVLRVLLTQGRATWNIEQVHRTVDGSTGADSPQGSGGGTNAAALVPREELLPSWPVVGEALAFRDAAGRDVYVIGASTASPGKTPTVLRAVAWMGLVGLVSATVAAWVVLGRALRPLLELAQSALNISPERRDGRLEAAGEQSEVEHAKHALNQALDRLESGYDALDLFIGNVTHELRTPVATVLAEARQIAIRERTPDEYASFVRSTGDEMARLGKMIQSFLTLARMDWEERRGLVVPISLFDVAVDVVQIAQTASKGSGVRIVLELPDDDDIEVRGDPELVTSMLDNVVRNAVRFSPPNALVEVEVRLVEDNAQIRVRDHGPGIPDHLIDDVFEPFVQGSSPPSGGRGSGIGLAIAQKVVELHKGRILIRNHRDGGCEVIVMLPLKSPIGVVNGTGDLGKADLAEE